MQSPRKSQKMFVWCIESALSLVLDYLSRKIDPLRENQLTEFFNEQLSKKGVDKRAISKMSYELKHQKYLEIVKGGSVALTDKARIKIIDHYSITKPNDTKRRLISFDIPEDKRRQRDCFRRTIKRMGFRQIQKSLWVCDKNLGDLVETVVKENEVEDYVAYFVIEKSNIDNHINEILHIS